MKRTENVNLTKMNAKRKNSTKRKQQPRKDSDSKRVNYDNTRVSKFEKDIKTSRSLSPTTKNTDNDISWYSRNPELLKSSASIPFNPIVGRKVDITSPSNTFIVPSMMVLEYQPMFAPLSNGVKTVLESTTMPADDATAQAFSSMYSYLVHANSRNYVYDPVDLGILIFAGMEVFSAISAMIRAYGLARRYMENNVDMPVKLLNALGFNDFSTQLGKAWFDINMLIDKTKQIWIPTTMPLLNRRIWLNTNVYYDENSITSQMYAFKQSTFFRYRSKASEKGGGLIATLLADNPIDWSTWVSTVDLMINSLLKEEDRGIIYGDILKAYGPDKIFALKPIDANYMTPIEYNPEVLTQIENATVVASSCVRPSAWLQTNGHSLVPMFGGAQSLPSHSIASTLYIGQYAAPNTPILNFHFKGQPTPEQVMIATRMMTCGNTVLANAVEANSSGTLENDGHPISITTTRNRIAPSTHGTEIVNRIYSTSFADDYIGYYDYKGLNEDLTTKDMLKKYLRDLGKLNAFDWHPFIYTLEMDTPTGETSANRGRVYDAYGEYDNYTTLNPNMLAKLHNVAYYSLMGVPQI